MKITKIPTITTEQAIIGTALVASTAAAVTMGVTATKVVLAKTAVPGAIATANVIINGTTYVMSKVALGLGAKLLTGIVYTIGFGYVTYETTKFIIKKAKAFNAKKTETK